MITIRPMVKADDLVVSQIVSECYRFITETDGLTPDQRDRMIEERCQPEHMAINRDRYTCHVAEADGSVVGFIAASGNHIEELFVHPSHHRQGIGTALFGVVETNTKQPVLTVETTGYGIPFYEAMGMHVTGTKRVTFGPLKGKALTVLEMGLPRERQAQPSHPTDREDAAADAWHSGEF